MEVLRARLFEHQRTISDSVRCDHRRSLVSCPNFNVIVLSWCHYDF
jgi:hypothetical protein